MMEENRSVARQENQTATDPAHGQTMSGENTEGGWRSRWDIGILVVFVSVWLAILFVFAFPLRTFDDESDIIRPAIDYITGHLHPHVKYPSFSFNFYGLIFKLFGTLNSTQDSLRVARVVNYFLFITNILLLHAFLRGHFSRLWALVGTILFTTLPTIVFSAIYVKTEGLLLFQLLCVLIALGRLRDRPNSLLWHAIAAIVSGLSISTKLSPLPLILCAANAIYIRSQGSKILLRAQLLFGGVFLATVLATWTNLWIFDKVLAVWKGDPYFLPGAGPWKAITGGVFSGFPYGRYSSFLTITVPIALGLSGVFCLCSLLARSIPKWILWVFGGGNLISLLIGLSATRMRMPHGFTSHTVFFFVAGISFLSWLGSRRSVANPIFNSRLAWVLVVASISQTAWQIFELPAFMSAVSCVRKVMHKKKGADISYLFASVYGTYLAEASTRHLSSQMENPESLREFISLVNPKELYVLSSYIDNMCKYTNQPTYRDNCVFFYNELMSGKTAYYVEHEDVIPLGGYLLIDPEFRHMRFILFRRSSGSQASGTPHSSEVSEGLLHVTLSIVRRGPTI